MKISSDPHTLSCGTWCKIECVTPTTTCTLTSSGTRETNEDTNPTPIITPTKLARRKALCAKTLFYFYHALSPTEYNCVSSCKQQKR